MKKIALMILAIICMGMLASCSTVKTATAYAPPVTVKNSNTTPEAKTSKDYTPAVGDPDKYVTWWIDHNGYDSRVISQESVAGTTYSYVVNGDSHTWIFYVGVDGTVGLVTVM